MNPPIQRALISVSDKMGLADFARGLVDAGVELFSTGGTRRHLEEAGLSVVDIATYTRFPEMMDGRLKTLHPKVFGGILCRHDRDDDMQSIGEHGIVPFELVVVNLYPFEATIARKGVTVAEAIEQIDIGGPSLVRAAAKNHAFTTISTCPEQYADILEQIEADGGTTPELRRSLAGAAFQRTATYDRAIADFFSSQESDQRFPQNVSLSLTRLAELRYGENPHQAGAVYKLAGAGGANLVGARQLHGKELSYNNLMDLDAALGIVRTLPAAATVVIKHTNPCGAASAETLAAATTGALGGDPVSAFGSVLGMNQPVDAATAEVLSKPGLFIEAIVAPSFDDEAVKILTTQPKWKTNVRLLAVGDLGSGIAQHHYRHIDGGLLIQDADVDSDSPSDWKVVTKTEADDGLIAQLRFAWNLCRFVKSNAIVLAREGALCGAGAGQMSRVDSVDIAIRKAGEKAKGSVLASDAFFPFDDSVHKAAEAGVVAIIQPGGSRRDDEVIAACDKHSLPMIFTGRRHFRH